MPGYQFIIEATIAMWRDLSINRRVALNGLVFLPILVLLLLQAGCSLDAVGESLATEVVNSATQYTFEVSETILANLFQL